VEPPYRRAGAGRRAGVRSAAWAILGAVDADDAADLAASAAGGEPVSRRDFERALRGLVLSGLDTRDALLQLAAHVVALTDELTRRLDGVEPQPAAPGTPAAPAAAGVTVEAAVAAALGPALAQIRATDAAGPDRIAIDAGEPKYGVVPADIPCAELIPLCRARCCKLSFALSTADLDEGVVRWDYAKPYVIRQRKSDGYCTHNDPSSHACTVHFARPRACRAFDCRRDPRIWIDFENRIPAPEGTRRDAGEAPEHGDDLMEHARERAVALRHERHAIDGSPGEDPPD